MYRKRCHSFEDDLCPQSKIHVGEKEINMGVNKEQSMKAVYAKTMEILMKASPKKACPDSTLATVQNINTNDGRYKQMFLDSRCKLQIQGSLKESQLKPGCGTCGSLTYCLQKCAFCEKYLCESCKCVCRKCEMLFCSSCIFSVFEGSDEFTICQSCY